MRLYCSVCFKSVSSEIPSTTIVRAALFCPECMERADVNEFDHLIRQMQQPGKQEDEHAPQLSRDHD